MEVFYLETKYEGKVELPKDLLKELPTRIMLATTIPFIDCLAEIKKKINAYHKEVVFFQGMHGFYPGQVLGCDTFRVKPNFDAFLYIGDGQFHPQAFLVNEKPVFCYNPLSEEWVKLGKKEWEGYLLRKKVSLMKYLSARTVGILISTKEGQNLMQGAVDKIREKAEKEGKEVYLFLGDTFTQLDLDNFPFIESWVNTACPRISDDFKGMVNLKDLV